MRTLLYGLMVAMLSLGGAAALLAMVRVVLVQVRDLTRLTRQFGAAHKPPGGRWEFADCGQPSAWPPSRHSRHLEP